jgi:HEAT repeat protein
VRFTAVDALGFVFSQVPDKQQAWNDLHRLTSDEDKNIRYKIVDALHSSLPHIPNKQQAWNDLHKLINDEDIYVRYKAVDALGSVFSQVPDKQQAWNELHRLIDDEDYLVRYKVVVILCSVFSQFPDKQQAWNDLHRLTNDKDSWVRSKAVIALGSSFSYIPDKQQALNDLHILVDDEDHIVRVWVADVLGSVFSQVPDKQWAWKDLQKLINDVDNNVRAYANHSLGKISIFKASQAEKEEDYKNELEDAINFFENSARESLGRPNPAHFCFPFYRSFHTIIFQKPEAEEEVDKYLLEANGAIKSSNSKKLLSEAVENLATALKEVQNLGNLDLFGMKCELSFYRIYCDHAAELMKDADEKAPYVTEVLKKGLPLLDRNLKDLLEEIQRKAEIACKESKKTATEEIACTVNREVQNWKISNPEKMAQNIDDLAYIFKILVSDIPQNACILDKIDTMRLKKDLAEQFHILSYIIGQLTKIDKISIKVEGNEDNVVVNSENVDIGISRDTPNSSKISSILEWISEHIIAALLVTTIGGIVVVFIQNKYFS